MCALRDRCIKPVPGIGEGPLMLVGEYPSWQDDKKGECYVGREGDLIKTLLKEAEIHSYRLTNLVKCNPGYKGEVEQEHIDKCKGWLWSEIKQYKPKVIVTLGKIPAVALLKLKKSQVMSEIVRCGQLVNWDDNMIWVHPWYSPGYIQNNTKVFWDSKGFFKRIKGLL